MNDCDDDVSNLFKAIGGKDQRFKEFGEPVKNAQDRWPMLSAIALEKRTPPPQLLQNEKKLWEKSATPATLPTPPAAKSPSLANRIAHGLHKLNLRQTAPAAPASQPAPLIRAEAAVRASTHPSTAPETPKHLPPHLATHLATHLAPPLANPANHTKHSKDADHPHHASPSMAAKTMLPARPFAKLGLNADAQPDFAPNADAGLFGQRNKTPREAQMPTPPRAPSGSTAFTAPTAHSSARLFGTTAQPAPPPVKPRSTPHGKLLFAAAPAEPPANSLSRLFTRLAEPEPTPTPAPSINKKRSLFSRMDKF